MNPIIFVIGFILTFGSAAMSFYPVFQDFEETDYIIPFHKSEDYPNEKDLLIMNVYGDCQLSDNIFSQYAISDEPICDISKNWVISLLITVFIGITIMMIGALASKKDPYF